MSLIRKLLAALALLVALQAVSAMAGQCYHWQYRKFGGGYGNGSTYCSPYQGFFGSPYYGGLNGAHWNRRGWGYDGALAP